MEPYPFNNGVLGQSIAGITYFDNESQIAMIGNFLLFQQNPTQTLNHVGACTTDGKTCYPLGNGLEDYHSYGSLRNIGTTLYALYINTEHDAVVAMYDTSASDDDWITILKLLSAANPSQYLSIEVYQGSLWLFGNITTPDNQIVSAARWNSTENSWEYIYTSKVPEYLSYQSETSLSPDGSTVYLMNYYYATTQILYWNNTIGNWTFQTTQDLWCLYPSTIAALNDGSLLGCEGLIFKFPEGTPLPGLQCDDTWTSLTVSADGTVLYAFCAHQYQDSLQTFSYNLTQQSVIVASNISDFEAMDVQLDSMCLYGQKIAITGMYNKVGGVDAPTFSIWDNTYQKWYRVTEKSFYKCYAGCQGDTMAAVCTTINSTLDRSTFLILDNANSDPRSQLLIQNIQQFNLNITGAASSLQVRVVGNLVYFSILFGDLQLALYQWSVDGGLETVLNFTLGTYLQFDFDGDVLYLAGTFATADNNYVRTIRYNMTNKTWLPLDSVFLVNGNVTHTGSILAVQFWNSMDQIYIAGNFNRIGDLKVSNWGGYNSEGVGTDSVSGGVQEIVRQLVPIGNRMYFTIGNRDCTEVGQPGCGDLIYYDSSSLSYSVVIVQEVDIMASGDTNPSSESSSSSSDFADWKLAIIVATSVFSASFIILLSVMLYRRIGRSKRFYQEIPDMGVFASTSITPIDFQHDDFVLKSVLGRGAYGTVWSCVFPNKEGGTYAVKQMLFSKGEVKKIDIVRQEIDILEKFRHPHIVHYCGHRMETTPTSVEFFIFMELYDQPHSLKGVIQKKLKASEKKRHPEWFTYQEVKKFLIQISDGLHYLHLNGVAHRDLKCANILVRMKGSKVTSLHIADFGISRVMHSEDGVSALASTVLGTPSFMAPEILKNQKYDAFKADIWSFGMMMYEMLSWKEPSTPGRKPEFPEQVTNFMNQGPQFGGIMEIFDKCTEIEPNMRPTASDLLYFCESLN